jgi:serine/threonine protein phosphatase PrpC
MPFINHQQLAQIETDDKQAPVITWQSAARSHVGRVRKLNEDAFINSTEHGLWAVADGMGGFARGDYASGVVVESLVHFVRQQTLTANIMNLEARLAEAHLNCRTTFKGEQIGSTVAALFSCGSYCLFLWAGDSRVYRLRANELRQMTMDHTVAQEKCTKGELRPGQVAFHPGAHVLTRAVGVHQTLHLDLHFERVEQSDRFLLCSDGLSNELSAEDIQHCLENKTCAEGVDALIERALDKGGRDNITALLVEADKLAPKQATQI